MRSFVRVLLLVLLAGVVLNWLFAARGPDVADGSVLVLDVGGEYVEAPEPPLIARLLGGTKTPLLRLYSQLRKAERDPRLHAVVLRISPSRMGWGKAQEVRDALLRLREAGKKTVAYVEVEPIGANAEYYMASAAETIWVSPGTRIPFVGLAAEYLFLGGFFEKLGVEIEVERVGPHKTAADFLAGRSMSGPARDMANWLLDSIDDQFLGGIAEARGLEQAELRRLIAQSPASPDELIAAGLVDKMGFLSDVLDDLGAERTVIESDEWALVEPFGDFEPQAIVALVYGSGNVVTGDADRTRRGDPVLAGRAVARNIEEAAEDDSVAAILFRIDSPGGSALASDAVWHATQLAREKKPVVVSFSDVAASGGYYVACGADAIYSQPGTITGSIGVVMMRPVLSGLYEKLGIGFEVLTRGDNARLFTLSQTLDAEDRKRLGDEVEGTYQLFLDRVEAGRGMDRGAIDAVGRGRVWTGAQAREHGLVDELGGIYAAVAGLREKLGLDPDADVALTVYPPPASFPEQLASMLQGAAARAAGPELPLPGAARTAIAWLEGIPVGAPALLPPLALEIQ
jgi:protease-4